MENIETKVEKSILEKQQNQNMMESESEYVNLLMKKNLRFSLNYHSFDVLSYFKMRSCF